MQAKPTSLLALLAAAFLALPAFAADHQASVPAKAISSDTSFVGYVSLDGITPDALAATAHTFTAGLPDSAKAIRQQLDAQIDAGVAKMKNTLAKFTDAGAHTMLFGMNAADPGAKPQHFSLVQGDSSTTVSNLTAALKNAASGKAAQTPPKVSRFIGNWFALQGKGNDLPTHGGDTQTASKFQSVLNSAGKAPIRFAFVMNPKAKQALTAMQTQPSALAAFAGPLQSLNNATLTVMPGKAPALNLDMNFADAQSAQTASTLLTSMLAMGKAQIEAHLTQGPNALSPKLVENLFKALQPTVAGKQLAIGLHTQFVQNLAKVVPAVMPMIQRMQQMHSMPQQPQPNGGGLPPFGPQQQMPRKP